uniref:Putative secreted protein n=1 Tax=Ixodes ricinus TaxID=34613 RepID=A0A6B0TS31_IXORI
MTAVLTLSMFHISGLLGMLYSRILSVATWTRSASMSPTVASGNSVIWSKARGFQFLICITPLAQMASDGE